jgi:hypothetical protein
MLQVRCWLGHADSHRSNSQSERARAAGHWRWHSRLQAPLEKVVQIGQSPAILEPMYGQEFSYCLYIARLYKNSVDAAGGKVQSP